LDVRDLDVAELGVAELVWNDLGAGDLIERQREFSMRRHFSRFLGDQSGATAIEYCLIATGIAFAIIATVQGIGPQLNIKFSSINSSLK
jgi:pilus assembly protein Flp/PilA